MFSIEGVVSASGLYRLILLEDIGTGAELFPGNSLALLGLDLGQRVQFARWSVALRPAHLQFMHDVFVSWLALASWSTCISASSVVGARGLL